MNANIVIVGVGGQGILLTSRILGAMALNLGMDIKVSEVHGMSQRGGSVITHVRIGEKVFSPLIDPHEADYVVSFEYLEALRAQAYLKDGGTLIVNQQKIMPMPVISGLAVYPETPLKAGRVIEIDALDTARKAGSAKAVNIVLLGVLAKQLGQDRTLWEKAVAQCVPEKTIQINLAAFGAGFDNL